MATGTAFGPQGLNAASTPPGGGQQNRYGVGVDTWVQDCGTSGEGGTVLNAAFFNMLLGNMRQAVQSANTAGATIELDDGDYTLLWQAILYAASLNSYTVGNGLALDANNQITVDVPALKVMIA